MTTLGEYCLHLITQHVMEEGYECAGACVRILDQIDFHSVQRWKARKRVIDGVSVETTYQNAFVRQILSRKAFMSFVSGPFEALGSALVGSDSPLIVTSGGRAPFAKVASRSKRMCLLSAPRRFPASLRKRQRFRWRIGRGRAEALHALSNKVIIAGRREEVLDQTTDADPGSASVTLDERRSACVSL